MSFGSCAVTLNELDGSTFALLRYRESIEPAVHVLHHVGVSVVLWVALHSRPHVILCEESIRRIHRRQHCQQPFSVGRLADELLSRSSEGSVEAGITGWLISTHPLVDETGELSSRRWVDTVTNADIFRLRQPVVPVADAPLHKLNRHQRLLQLWAVELVAAQALVEALLVVHDDSDLLGTDHSNSI